MIELGLARITRLLKDTPTPWRAIHVAGTNGKGSVLNKRLFHEVEAMVKARDQQQDVGASEFEILTATAFEIFNMEKIEVGIVEVGLGGRHDATNVLKHPAVTVITKIGEDHQSFLGNTLEEIAYQKAGIMKKGVPCVVDGSNPSCVVDVLVKNAANVGAASMRMIPQDFQECNSSWTTFPYASTNVHQQHMNDQVWAMLSKDDFETHQQMNICLAFHAIKEALASVDSSLDPRVWLPAIEQIIWPGRLQTLSIEALVGTKQHILLDGAHNIQSAEVLGSYVERKVRKNNDTVTWVIAMSKGKDIKELLARLFKPNDRLIAVEFGPVDGMPWVVPEKRENLVAAARSLDVEGLHIFSNRELNHGLQWAAHLADGQPLVVAGSLYLVSDVLRMLRNEP
ncbi:dihydrofolate synthase, partial [Lecanoromycetidae sp. Uapishka_2]